jgi:hypothetical protein
MKHRHWLYLFALTLVLSSLVLFSIHYLVFGDLHHILLYSLHDIAFLPVEVLLVTVVIHSLLERQNLQQKLEKLNMVIGTFYSKTGTLLIREFARYDPEITALREEMAVTTRWNASTYKSQKKKAVSFSYTVDIHQMDLTALRNLLLTHEDFLLRILENPVMIEHESFSDVLRAVFHLSEELKNRGRLDSLPESDLAHLKGDIKRAYSRMTLSWLDYMQYLQNEYPYLFSLAIRINPFSAEPDPTVKE